MYAAFSFHFSICVLPLAVLLYRAISRWIKSKASVNGEYNLPTLDITLWNQVVFTEMNKTIFCSDHDFRSFHSLLFNTILLFQLLRPDSLEVNRLFPVPEKDDVLFLKS